MCGASSSTRSRKITTHQHQLAGLRILNTRPETQSHELSHAIRQANGVAVDLPTIQIISEPNFLKNMPKLDNIQHIIFVSKHAISFFFETLNQEHIVFPKHLLISVLGHGSAKTLLKYHPQRAIIPSISDSEHLLDMAHFQSVTHQNILIVHGEGGRDLLEKTLKNRGANIHKICVYQRNIPVHNPAYLKTIWQNDSVDIILFTSQQAMENLFTLLGPKAHRWIRQKPCVVISPRLANAAAILGIKMVITSPYEQLLNVLEGFKHGPRSTVIKS